MERTWTTRSATTWDGFFSWCQTGVHVVEPIHINALKTYSQLIPLPGKRKHLENQGSTQSVSRQQWDGQWLEIIPHHPARVHHPSPARPWTAHRRTGVFTVLLTDLHTHPAVSSWQSSFTERVLQDSPEARGHAAGICDSRNQKHLGITSQFRPCALSRRVSLTSCAS